MSWETARAVGFELTWLYPVLDLRRVGYLDRSAKAALVFSSAQIDQIQTNQELSSFEIVKHLIEQSLLEMYFSGGKNTLETTYGVVAMSWGKQRALWDLNSHRSAKAALVFSSAQIVQSGPLNVCNTI
ncbi:hypothetical protein Ae201684P_017357 [Aphanomyces euteiches]|nr:hypothetical protein Ae201684P_017357 [Aphanomyces euteiches]